MRRNNKIDIINGHVPKVIFKLTYPLVFGVFSIVAFNFTDTYFVSLLGTRALTAISFSFPIVIFVGSIALGIGIGAGSLISRTIGEWSRKRIPLIATNSILLALVLAITIIWMGLSSMDKIFILLGAAPDIVPYIDTFMKIWFIGAIFFVIPMVGNNAMRATGDTILPSLIMILASVLNVILDPLFIFGLLGFPKMGLEGAAVATLISRATACFACICFLHYRHRMLTVKIPKIKTILITWWKILYVGVPAAATNIFIPITLAIITRFASSYGPDAVAAFGAGRRIQALAFMVYLALGAAIIPFVGQNFGAGRVDRIKSGLKTTYLFSIVYGIIIFILFYLFSEYFAALFSINKEVIHNITLYLCIVSIGYGFQGIARTVCQGFNALNKPLYSFLLNFMRFFLFYVIFSYIGSKYFGLLGLFTGICVANLLSGTIAIILITIHLKKNTALYEKQEI
ncbi:MAG TPA: MATE family efflux transporter [Victivallales bacterium]|nr:MATE family efflux transporter [Victivallales bacterium]